MRDTKEAPRSNFGIPQIPIKIPMPIQHKPNSPYDLYLEKQAELERILTKDEVCAIMDEVNPLANTYTLPVAVMRLNTIVQLAAAGAHGEELLDIVKNFQEDAVLYLVHNGHRDLFNPSANDKLADLATEE